MNIVYFQLQIVDDFHS